MHQGSPDSFRYLLPVAKKIALTLLSCASIGLVGCGNTGESVDAPGRIPDVATDVTQDVEISRCGVDQLGTLSATLDITNNGEVQRNYQLVVVVLADGQRIAELRTTAAFVQPGNTSTARAAAPPGALLDPDAELSCELASGLAYPSPRRSGPNPDPP